MKFLPIVERELRVASRQRGTYWARLSSSLVALLIGGWILLVPNFRSTKTMGMALFAGLGFFAMLYSILAGLRTTSDCLSEEKREGTLGLLFLTDLKGYDIVLGKLVATSLNTFYGLLAMFPVLAIPLMLGGVAIEEFARVLACCLNNLFFSLSMGMFCSSISKDDRKSMVATLLLLMLFVMGLPALGGILTELLHTRSPSPLFFIFSPGYASFAAYEEPFNMLLRQKFNYFYLSMACIHLLSWGLIALSCYVVPRTWKDAAATPAKSRRQEKLNRLKHGQPQTRAQTRARLLDINPIYWLTSRDRLKTVCVWGVLGLGGLIWAWGLSTNARDWKVDVAYVITAVIVHTILKCWIALEASRRFGLDRKSGALELILSTPITLRQIILGQLQGLTRQFLGPMLLVLLVDFIFLMTDQNNSEWVIVWIAGMAVFVVDMLVLSLLSMWRGFATSHPGRGAITSIFLILVLPWLLFLGFLTLTAVTGLISRFARSFYNTEVLIGLWTAISLAIDIGFGLWAWNSMLTRFRSLSSQRVSRKWGKASRPDPMSPAVPTPPPVKAE